MGVHLARGAIAALGLLILLAGAAIVAFGGAAAFLMGAMVFGTGALLLIVAVVERMRYRSSASEQIGAAIGPGGGEPVDAPIEARFLATNEVFVDPTTHVRMRVLLDVRTGERRYVADR